MCLRSRTMSDLLGEEDDVVEIIETARTQASPTKEKSNKGNEGTLSLKMPDIHVSASAPVSPMFMMPSPHLSARSSFSPCPRSVLDLDLSNAQSPSLATSEAVGSTSAGSPPRERSAAVDETSTERYLEVCPFSNHVSLPPSYFTPRRSVSAERQDKSVRQREASLAETEKEKAETVTANKSADESETPRTEPEQPTRAHRSNTSYNTATTKSSSGMTLTECSSILEKRTGTFVLVTLEGRDEPLWLPKDEFETLCSPRKASSAGIRLRTKANTTMYTGSRPEQERKSKSESRPESRTSSHSSTSITTLSDGPTRSKSKNGDTLTTKSARKSAPAHSEDEEEEEERPSRGRKRTTRSSNAWSKPRTKKPKVYEVEKILAQTSTEYKVKWKGYDEMTWEPKENLKGCDFVIRRFEQQLAEAELEAKVKEKETTNKKNDSVKPGPKPGPKPGRPPRKSSFFPERRAKTTTPGLDDVSDEVVTIPKPTGSRKDTRGDNSKELDVHEEQVCSTGDAENQVVVGSNPESRTEEYTVEAVLAETRDEFFVKWWKYGLDECTWEPKSNLEDFKRLVRHFRKRQLVREELGRRISYLRDEYPGFTKPDIAEVITSKDPNSYHWKIIEKELDFLNAAQKGDNLPILFEAWCTDADQQNESLQRLDFDVLAKPVLSEYSDELLRTLNSKELERQVICVCSSGKETYDHSGCLIRASVMPDGEVVHECDPVCMDCDPGYCNQKVSQQGRRVALALFCDPIARSGWSLRAAEEIKEGTFLGELIGDIYCRQDIDDVRSGDPTYPPDGTMWQVAVACKNTTGYFYVDIGERSNEMRFMERSSIPNVVVAAVTRGTRLPRLAFFAKTLIELGDVLCISDDYPCAATLSADQEHLPELPKVTEIEPIELGAEVSDEGAKTQKNKGEGNSQRMEDDDLVIISDDDDEIEVIKM